MKKYYWILGRGFWYDIDSNAVEEEEVTDIHPFEYAAEQMGNVDYTLILVNWKEITEEEYNLFKKLHPL